MYAGPSSAARGVRGLPARGRALRLRRNRRGPYARAHAPPTPGASCSATPVSGQPALRAERIASSLDQPVDLQTPGDRTRLFVVEQRGRIRICAAAWWRRRSSTSSSASAREAASRACWASPSIRASPRTAASSSTTPTLGRHPHRRVPRRRRSRQRRSRQRSGRCCPDQPFANHNGGELGLRPRRLPLHRPRATAARAATLPGNGQNLGTPARQDPAHRRGRRRSPTRMPADNPFVRGRARGPRSGPTACATRGASPSTAATGDLYIGDVGQNARRGGQRGAGAAPRRRELRLEHHRGHAAASARQPTAPRDGITFPVVEYTPRQGCSITGGVVYRGCRMPGYAGTYFYGDYCAGFVRSFRLQGGQADGPARLDVAARHAAEPLGVRRGCRRRGVHPGAGRRRYRIVPAG